MELAARDRAILHWSMISFAGQKGWNNPCLWCLNQRPASPYMVNMTYFGGFLNLIFL
jgi:hypothetical protein